jgi:hypothetical protein
MKLKYFLKVLSILLISTGLATAYPDRPIEKYLNNQYQL